MSGPTWLLFGVAGAAPVARGDPLCDGAAYACPLPDAPTWLGGSPWYGMDRETLRQWAWNDGAGRDGARIPGAEPPDGVPATVDAIAGDLDAPVTWVAILEPTEDPRSDAAVVELLPLEPMVTWASSSRQAAWAWSDVFHLERPDCPRAAAADDFERNRALYPNMPL